MTSVPLLTHGKLTLWPLPELSPPKRLNIVNNFKVRIVLAEIVITERRDRGVVSLIAVGCKMFVLICCYRSSFSNRSFAKKLCDGINNIIKSFRNTPLVVLGDFDYPDIVWCGAGPLPGPSSSASNHFFNV